MVFVEGGGSLTYTAVAKTAGSSEEYRAAITGMYANRGEGWKLVLHQQTPLPSRWQRLTAAPGPALTRADAAGREIPGRLYDPATRVVGNVGS